MEKHKVLILCTGNSCRSQMAEGFINHFFGDRWHAYSAGTAPSGSVHPLAVRAMGEAGIDLSGHRSKSTDVFRNTHFDLVITVCDDAAENCPAWLGEGEVIHLGFRDPARATGAEEAQMVVFREVRDQIQAQVLGRLRGVS